MNQLRLSKTVLFLISILVSQIVPAKALHNVEVIPIEPENATGEVSIYFPVNQSRLLRDFSGNAKSLMILDKMLNDKNFYHDIDSVVINGYASPEGSITHNSRLSYERARAVKDYIAQNFPHIRSTKIFTVGRLVDMKAIEEIINNDLSVPFRQEAQGALAMQGFSDVERLSLLKDVGDGKTIQHITKHYATSLRSATGIMFYRASDHISTTDTVVINQKEETVLITKSTDTVFIDNHQSVRKPVFALKTNLLYDLGTALNLELEIPIGQHWSVLGEYIFPWWLMENKQYCLQVVNANLEVRYWFGNRSQRPKLTGWFAGIYGGGGYYDIEWGNNGYQGEFYLSTGLTAGFAHTLGKSGNFRMEYSLGAGYLSTDYNEYIPEFGSDDKWHLIRQKSGNYNWIGPTRAKISLVWMLHRTSYQTKKQND